MLLGFSAQNNRGADQSLGQVTFTRVLPLFLWSVLVINPMAITVVSTTDDPKEAEAQLTADGVKNDTKVTVTDGMPLVDSPAEPETDTTPPAIEPTPEKEVAATPEADGEADTPKQDGESEPPSGSVQSRITRALRDKHSALARAEDLERKLNDEREKNLAAEKAAEDARSAPKPETPAATPKSEPVTNAEPELEAFANYEDWVKAHTKWELSSSIASMRKEITDEIRADLTAKDAELQKGIQSDVEAELLRGYNERHAETQSRHADFDEVMKASEALPISQEMKQTFVMSPMGTEMMYHLSKNPEETERLRELPSGQQFMELGKLEARLEAKTPAASPKPNVTSAPPPIETVGTAPVASALADDHPDLPYGEFVRRREEHEKSTGRR